MKIRILILSSVALGLFVFSTMLAQSLEVENYDSAAMFKNRMFADVDTDHEYFDAIYFLHNTGVIDGYTKPGSQVKEYKAENNINRAEFLKLVMEGTGVATNATYDPCFPDVTADAWFTTYVCQAKTSGMVNGYPDGNFKPDQPITEIEAIKILGEVSGWQLRDLKAGDDWYEPYLEIAAGAGIVPKNNITVTMNRGDIAEMIFRDTQVDYFDVPTFDQVLVDDLFYYYDIPYGGALGPDGLLGPGGPFGNAGAFNGDGDFVEQDGTMKFLGEDFYTDKYCYYSDEGGHYERVEEILGQTGDDLSGFDSVGLGMMYCYNGVAATDLKLFTKEDRDSYGVFCWSLPDEIKLDGGYDEIMCYAPPEEPEWVDFDSEYCVSESVDGAVCTVCYESVLSNVVTSSACTEAELKSCCFVDSEGEFCVDMNPVLCLDQGGSVVDAGASDKPIANLKLTVPSSGYVGWDDTNIQIAAYDADGVLTSAGDLNLKVSTGFDYMKELGYLQGNETGSYFSNFATSVAGEYLITVRDEETGVIGTATVEMLPGNFDEVLVQDVVYDYENGAPNKAMISAVSVDEFNNVLPYSTVNNHLIASTTLGAVSVAHDDEGHYTFTVEADDWGVADVSIKNKAGAIVAPAVQVFFFPVQIDFPKGIEMSEGQIDAPVYIYFPENHGKLGTYEINLMSDLNGLTFLDVEDPVPSDDYKTPSVSVGDDGSMHIEGTFDGSGGGGEIVPVASLLFNVTAVGSGSIYVENAVLTNTDGEEKSYWEKYSDAVGGSVEGLAEGFWRWWYKVKPTKDVCLDIFAFDGSGATAATVLSDVNQTNTIFGQLAAKCNCSSYLNFSYNFYELTAEQWNTVDANGDGMVNSDGVNDANLDEIDHMMDNHPPRNAACIPVYYVPALHNGWLGLSSYDDNSKGVALDHSKDNDGRTLAHELAHQLSHNDVVDQPHDKADEQGADQPGNLMHYDDTGDNLTVEQCGMIESYLP